VVETRVPVVARGRLSGGRRIVDMVFLGAMALLALLTFGLIAGCAALEGRR